MMMLIYKERSDTIKRLGDYPAGINAMFWGFGPLMMPFKRYTLTFELGRKYG